MIDIIVYLLIILICGFLSYVAKGLVDKFCKEDELIEEFKQNNEERIKNATKEENKIINKEIKALKAKFKPSFSLPIFLILSLMICLLYTFVFKNSIEHFFIYSIITFLVTICAFTDIKRCIIPDEINLVGFIIGIIYTFFKLIFNTQEGIDLIFGGLLGFGIFALIYLFSLLVFKKEGMGGGDIKLMGVLGMFFGVKSIIQIFILSFFFASIISIFLLVTKIKSKSDYIAFGPFIVLACFVTMFFSGAYTYNQILLFIAYNYIP